ncbi:hypothetical protein JRC04_04790 [Mycolicibacterium sp. S2-37]|uniref:hypothetical protein n=1 Tax=Mycolicibacterium sp. S2-37 TaxID=2810297 RepID=UPI001A943585|nr:hypothetical protein [Mycolicibacterium sp. S2-37]MBO0676776.1 hypothetical protein [Mycolicibacterium sp. S2-37]
MTSGVETGSGMTPAPNIPYQPTPASQWADSAFAPTQESLFTAEQIDLWRGSFIEMVLRVVTMAFQGVLNLGESAFDQLVEFASNIPLIGPIVEALTGFTVGGLDRLADWAERIPFIGDLVRAITNFFDPNETVSLDFLGDWFDDLMNILGNPFGLGSGEPKIGPLNSIPILGPVLNGIANAITGVVGAGLATLEAFFGEVPLIGDIIHALTGIFSTDIEVLGEWSDGLQDSIQNIIDAVLTAIRGIPIVGGSIADMITQLTGLKETSADAKAQALNAYASVTNLANGLITAPSSVIGSIGQVKVDGVATVQTLLNGLHSAAQPSNRPSGSGVSTPELSPVPRTVAAVYSAHQAVKNNVRKTGSSSDTYGHLVSVGPVNQPYVGIR